MAKRKKDYIDYNTFGEQGAIFYKLTMDKASRFVGTQEIKLGKEAAKKLIKSLTEWVKE